MRAALIIATAAGVALAGPAFAGGKPKVDPLIVKPGGKVENCISRSRIRESRVRDDSTIDFYMLGGDVYRNNLPNKCPSLGFEQSFGYSTSIDQFCSVDIITVLHTGGGGPHRGASCGLGKFTEMAKKGK